MSKQNYFVKQIEVGKSLIHEISRELFPYDNVEEHIYRVPTYSTIKIDLVWPEDNRVVSVDFPDWFALDKDEIKHAIENELELTDSGITYETEAPLPRVHRKRYIIKNGVIKEETITTLE